MVIRIAVCWIAALTLAAGIGACGDDDSGGDPAPCSVTENPDGSATITCPDGTSATVPSGTVAGVLTGTVTNSLTGAPLEGVAVAEKPAIEGVAITTDADGTYSAMLPVGVYTLKLQKDGFETTTATASVVSNQMVTADVALEPTQPVAVTITATPSTVEPGGTTTLTAMVEIYNGATVESYEWTQVPGPAGLEGAPATITSPDAESTEVTLASRRTIIRQLYADLDVPDRTGVVPVYPELLTEAAGATFELTVTTDDGQTYTQTVHVTAELPFFTANGIRNVPINQPVLVHAAADSATSFNWSLTQKPAGSDATMQDATGQTAYFTPDEIGTYQVAESSTGASITIYAGTWVGAITGVNDEGEPLAEGCRACHVAEGGPLFFNSWAETAHATSFERLFDTFDHFQTSCMQCHTVGYNPDANNDGIDDQANFEEFLETFTSNGTTFIPNPDNFQRLLDDYPAIAQRTNVQCESCHGPNNSPAHPDVPDARITYASTDCAICHADLPRYGSYLQWKESGHANFELAIEEATVENRPASAFFPGAGHCGRCHSAQGFLSWIYSPSDLDDMNLDVYLLGATVPISDPAAYDAQLAALGLTVDMVQPQTCPACHNPHSIRDVYGGSSDFQIRINGDTAYLPAGYTALGVGLGALCITCHNTRNGPHNPSNPPTDYETPHVAAQGDVLMGENSYFYVGQRSPHSFIPNTCVDCHMVKTPPPAALSFEGEGPNHTFTASLDICEDCHLDEAVNGEALQAADMDALATLRNAIAALAIQDLSALSPFTVTPYDAATDTSATTTVTISQTPTAVQLADVHGQMAFILTLPSPIVTPFGTSNMVEFQLETMTPAIPTDSVLIRAIWNYFLLEDEASFGIHNPPFSFGVIAATLTAVNAERGVP